jgi:hypothetical protein
MAEVKRPGRSEQRARDERTSEISAEGTTAREVRTDGSTGVQTVHWKGFEGPACEIHIGNWKYRWPTPEPRVNHGYVCQSLPVTAATNAPGPAARE